MLIQLPAFPEINFCFSSMVWAADPDPAIGYACAVEDDLLTAV
jgi:hypothetical protein